MFFSFLLHLVLYPWCITLSPSFSLLLSVFCSLCVSLLFFCFLLPSLSFIISGFQCPYLISFSFSMLSSPSLYSSISFSSSSSSLLSLFYCIFSLPFLLCYYHDSAPSFFYFFLHLSSFLLPSPCFYLHYFSPPSSEKIVSQKFIFRHKSWRRMRERKYMNGKIDWQIDINTEK